MNFVLCGLTVVTWIALSKAHTHDEISKCTLTGVYKTRQTILESPNYPDNYPAGSCWDYVIRSPFRCPTKFHIQFLDFYLETSKNCKNDYLAVGLDNVDDDMDTLCGQVVGIKKYHTPDGVLRLRFYADESAWTTGKGFKLLVTRLACEDEDVLRELPDNDDDDTITVTAPTGQLMPPQTQIMDIFRNFTGIEQHQLYPLPPLFGLNYPTQLPSPPYPTIGGYYLPSGAVVQQQNYLGSIENTAEKPCKDNTQQQQQQHKQPQPYLPPYVTNNNNYLPVSRDQYVGTWPTSSYLRAIDGSGSTRVEACCTSAFQQKRFYLSSPGFPRTIFSNLLPTERRDCEFRVQKHSANVCRLRVEFKFFDFGQNFQGTGSIEGNIGLPAIASSHNTCTDDYIEIGNQRFCGCRSDYVHNAFWNFQGDQRIRMRMGHSGIPSGGFLLEIVQEECSETQFSTSTIRPVRPISPTTVLPFENQNNFLNQQNPQSQNFGQSQSQQQQSNGLTQQHFGGLPQVPNYQSPAGFQQIFNTPGFSPIYQQPQISFTGNGAYQHPPPTLVSGSYPGYQYQNPNLLPSSPYGLPQLRYARSYADQQPVSIVETNTTRKEYYFNDNEDTAPQSAFVKAQPKLAIAMSRSSKAENGVTRWDAEDIKAHTTSAQVRQKCTFDMGDILRLSVDVLWLTKPTCYAPQRNWFTNFLG